MRRLTQTVKKFIKVPGYIIYLKKSDTCSSEDNTENILFMTATMCLVIQSCLTLCDPMKSSPPGSSVPGILQAGILEWVAISFSNACMDAKSLQSCSTLCDPMAAAHRAPLSTGFSRQEYCSGLPYSSFICSVN